MKIAIRKEKNGSIYIDKEISRFGEDLTMFTKEPYNYKIVNIENKFIDFENIDFNDKLEFDSAKYYSRKSRENAISEIEIYKSKLAKYDYIGTKIATGRASIEDYAVQIAEMREFADKINELEKLL